MGRGRRDVLRRSWYRSVVVTLVALSSSSCLRSRRSSESVARDSAGIHIIESGETGWASGAEWRIAREPQVSLGAVDAGGASSFGRIVDAHLWGRTRLLVVDAQASQVHVFDVAGKHLFSVGAPGDGPGEFRAPASVQVIGGDTLAVFDRGLRRISRFLSTGQFLDSRALEGIQVDGSPAFLAGVAYLASGTLVGREGGDLSGMGLGATRDTVKFVALDPASPIAQTIAEVPGAWTIHMEYQGHGAYRLQPLTPNPSWSILGDTLYIAGGEWFEIRRVTMGGVTTILRRPLLPNLVSDEDQHAFSDAMLRAVPEEQRPEARKLVESMPFPERLPAYSSVLVDPDGYVWAEHFASPGVGPGPAWDVFEPSGEYLGAVATPPGLKLLEVGRDYVLGVWSDELDVQYVHLHRLDRSTVR